MIGILYTGNNFMMSDWVRQSSAYTRVRICAWLRRHVRGFLLYPCASPKFWLHTNPNPKSPEIFTYIRTFFRVRRTLVRLFLTSTGILKNQRDLYLRNRPVNRHHANSSSSIRKILVTGRENVTNIQPDFLNFNENSFIMSKSGEIAVTSNNLWLKERNDSGGVQEEINLQ